jgi:hypothetical protein
MFERITLSESLKTETRFSCLKAFDVKSLLLQMVGFRSIEEYERLSRGTLALVKTGFALLPPDPPWPSNDQIPSLEVVINSGPISFSRDCRIFFFATDSFDTHDYSCSCSYIRFERYYVRSISQQFHSSISTYRSLSKHGNGCKI